MAERHWIGEEQSSESMNQEMDNAIELTFNDSDSSTIDYESQTDHLDSSNEKVYECGECSFTFAEQHVFEIHKLKHSLANPFKCGICNASFPNAEALSLHINNHMELLGKETETETVATKRKVDCKRKREPRKCARYQVSTNDCDEEKTSDIGISNQSDDFSVEINDEVEPYSDEMKTLLDVDESEEDEPIRGRLKSSRQYTNKYIMKHRRTQSNLESKPPRTVNCPECDRTFTTEYHMNMHLKTHSQPRKKTKKENGKCKKNENVECEVCQKICISEYHLKLHLQKHLTKEKRNERVTCDICFHTYSTNQALRTHLLSHTNIRPFQCAVCGKAFRWRAVLERHQAVHAEKSSYKCDHCPSSFKSADRLKAHTRRSHIETLSKSNVTRRHFCDVCKEYFTDRGHAKIHHEVSFICEICGNSFKKRGGLTEHVRLIHNTCELVKCTKCDKTFKTVSALNSHSSIHTGEKPFQCHICGSKFRLKCLLERHVIRHSGKKPHHCEVCGKGFNTPEHLRRHSIVHVPNRLPNPRNFVCHCGKGFTTQRYLRDHKITHTGNRSYVCVVCGSKYTQVAALLRHIKSHTINATNVQCRLCMVEFKELTELQMHMVVHNNPQNQSPNFNSENGFAILKMNSEDFDVTTLSGSSSVAQLPPFFMNPVESRRVYSALSDDNNMFITDSIPGH